MLWCSGSQKDFRQNVHSFTFESPMPRAMHLLGRPYRAVFTVRDPRDLIIEVRTGDRHSRPADDPACPKLCEVARS